MVREIIKKLVSEALDKIDSPKVDFTIEKPKTNFGDYAVNAAFGLAKKLDKPAGKIAQELAKKINQGLPKEIAEAKAVDGYVNFFLSQTYLQQQLSDIASQKDYGQSDLGRGKLVIVEYSQPNIAKKMHVGHLRTTVLGNALANNYQALGYKVVRWNYLGDWGTQFGKLIAAYKLWGKKEEVERNPIETLQNLYVKFHEELKGHSELEKRGQEEFKKLEDGDKENTELWQWFKEESLKEFNKIYRLLEVKFDVDISESFYEKGLKPLVEELLNQSIAEKSEGGVIINLDKYGLPPALIQKSDGASLYLTRDIANLKYRLTKFQPAKILYVVGNEQSLHFEQLFAIAKILGLNQVELVHVKYGLVLGEDKKKLATREGKAVSLEEIIEKAVALARQIVEEKNPALTESDKENIAQTVALGALKYEMLKEHRNTDIVFDWKRMLDFSGNSAPYLQYTYARLANILAKSSEATDSSQAEFTEIKEPAELAVIKQLLEFPDTLSQCQQTSLTNPLALYLYELANLANGFYESTPVLKDQNYGRRQARLLLIEVMAKVLERGLALLGIRVLKKI